jgi:hypothetical protein
MNINFTIDAGASRRQAIAAIQWIENLFANVPAEEIGRAEGLTVHVPEEHSITWHTHEGGDECTLGGDCREAVSVVFEIHDDGTWRYFESFWIDEDEVPPVLFGSEDPDHGLIELDFENRNCD